MFCSYDDDVLSPVDAGTVWTLAAGAGRSSGGFKCAVESTGVSGGVVAGVSLPDGSSLGSSSTRDSFDA
jgi:hypothetical protein